MNFIAFIFGHAHDLSRVFTIQGRTYKTCLTCGKEFEATDQEKIDWNVREPIVIEELERILTF